MEAYNWMIMSFLFREDYLKNKVTPLTVKIVQGPQEISKLVS